MGREEIKSEENGQRGFEGFGERNPKKKLGHKGKMAEISGRRLKGNWGWGTLL